MKILPLALGVAVIGALLPAQPVVAADANAIDAERTARWKTVAVFIYGDRTTDLPYDALPIVVVIDIQITLKQMLRDFIGIRVNRAKKSGMVNITSSVNTRERSGINTVLHEL